MFYRYIKYDILPGNPYFSVIQRIDGCIVSYVKNYRRSVDIKYKYECNLITKVGVSFWDCDSEIECATISKKSLEGSLNK